MYTARDVITQAIDEDFFEFYAHDYAEPGYSLAADKPLGILFANWNPTAWDNPTKAQRLMPRLAAIAERAGYEIDWSDTWMTCSICGKAIRTSADSYGWKPAYWHSDDGAVCVECIDPVEYLSVLEGDARQCNTFDRINPADHGYTLIKEGMAHGWHPGQNDSPQVCARSLRAHGVERFVFSLDAVGQFDAEFSVYVHNDEVALLETCTDVPSALPYDPGAEMGKALRGEHSDHYTMETRTITPEEFISGSWTKG